MGIDLTEQEIRNTLDAMAKKKVVVFGDFYLDQNIIGSMEGISREAPVPIVRVTSDDFHPGGGGNTVVNVGDLGMEVIPIGVIGNDLHGEIFFRELEKRNITTEFVIREEGRRTPTFNKIWASSFQGRPQQVARYDIENYTPTSQESLNTALESLQNLLPEIDGIIINDYNEVGNTGVVTDTALEFLRKVRNTSNVVIVADSRQNIGKCRDFTAVVPNEIETAVAVGVSTKDEGIKDNDQLIEEIGKKLHNYTNADYVIVTRGDRGASIIASGQKTQHVAAFSLKGEIDITGAGDTFASAITGALCVDLEIAKAVRFANLAASIIVKKLWTTGTATPKEIIQAATGVTKKT